jgi:FkbM family methyltransferase
MAVIQTRHGLMDIRYPDDFISKQLTTKKEYEWYVVELVTNICKEFAQGVILDVGANVGTVALPLARLFPDFQICAFEVQPELQNLLNCNVELNALTNIELYPFGLGDTAETKTIVLPDYSAAENIGAFSLHEFVQQQSSISRGHGVEHQIEIKRLDDVSIGQQPIRCIKLDIEGYELKMLQGAVQTLKIHNYPTIVYESWSYNLWWKDHRLQLESFLKTLGYNSFSQFDDTVVARHLQ